MIPGEKHVVVKTGRTFHLMREMGLSRRTNGSRCLLCGAIGVPSDREWFYTDDLLSAIKCLREEISAEGDWIVCNPSSMSILEVMAS